MKERKKDYEHPPVSSTQCATLELFRKAAAGSRHVFGGRETFIFIAFSSPHSLPAHFLIMTPSHICRSSHSLPFSRLLTAYGCLSVVIRDHGCTHCTACCVPFLHTLFYKRCPSVMMAKQSANPCTVDAAFCCLSFSFSPFSYVSFICDFRCRNKKEPSSISR